MQQNEAFADRLLELRNKLKNPRNKGYDPFHVVISRRSHVFEDSFRRFSSESNFERKLTHDLYIRVENEYGINAIQFNAHESRFSFLVNTLDIHLASSVYKYLLGITPSVDDVIEEDQTLSK